MIRNNKGVWKKLMEEFGEDLNNLVVKEKRWVKKKIRMLIKKVYNCIYDLSFQ